MVWDELSRFAESENQRDRDKKIGIFIGILAVILALSSMGGDNAAADAANKNIEAANTWSFFQAKNMRRHVLRVEVDELELQVLAQPDMPDEAKAAIAKKIQSYKEQDQKLTSDPVGKEGLDQLFEKAKTLEAARDVALKRNPYFDYASACLQIAIVLASVAIISQGSALLVVSAALGALGALLTFNGFTLALPLWA
jgi:Domain of unknown function (DUF4337)